MIFVKIEQEKSRLFMKSHKLTNFTLGSRISIQSSDRDEILHETY
jgi:hypothetical protein